ncbi:MAG: hypothetical protein GF309_08650 [Candidatus Lokiarchaeota archaeon]|nr:hypothetical protein [Candidatus Lokiarchaeota archaeon]
MGNRLATFLTSKLAGQRISDAQSGFRAIHRDLAQRLVVESKKTYVQETLIRSIRQSYKVVEVPIRFRKREGKSRLISSIWRYAFQVFPDLILTYVQVASLRFFGIISMLLLAAGIPFLSAGIIFMLSGNIGRGLSLLIPSITILAPTISSLMSAGLIIDYIHKLRMWRLEKEALKKDNSQ